MTANLAANVSEIVIVATTLWRCYYSTNSTSHLFPGLVGTPLIGEPNG